ncbi:MAG: hypothetical protein ACYCYM_03420 [Saccharofermentanales bacterium]
MFLHNENTQNVIVYQKSKNKVTAMMLVFFIISIAFLTLFICVYMEQKFKSTSATIITVYILTIVLMFYKLKPLYNQILKIGDDEIIFQDLDKNLKTVIKFNQIKSISYYGVQVIPMSEVMIIQTSTSKIYVDYNYIGYLDIWQEILRRCDGDDIECNIDANILKRIKNRKI